MKRAYFFKSLMNYFSSKACPNCGHKKVLQIDRKYLVTRLFLCQSCLLQFRHPKDDERFNQSFYQLLYKQSDGITTDLPNKQQLEELKKNYFKKSNKNADRYIKLIRFLFPERSQINVLDYGCNWGYTSYQFIEEGFVVQSYEISKPRAIFGQEKLGVDIKTDFKDIQKGVDIFFSSHVIEHHPNISKMLKEAKTVLKEGGYFIAYCPNGSSEFRERNSKGWHLMWGLVHPNLLSADFFRKTFKDYPYIIGSENASVDNIMAWDKESQITLDLTGGELFIIAKL